MENKNIEIEDNKNIKKVNVQRNTKIFVIVVTIIIISIMVFLTSYIMSNQRVLNEIESLSDNNYTFIYKDNYLKQNQYLKETLEIFNDLHNYNWDNSAIDKITPLVQSAPNITELKDIHKNMLLVGSATYDQILNYSSYTPVQKTNLIMNQLGYKIGVKEDQYYTKVFNEMDPLKFYPMLNEHSNFFVIFNNLVTSLDPKKESKWDSQALDSYKSILNDLSIDSESSKIKELASFASSHSLEDQRLHYFRVALNQLIINSIKTSNLSKNSSFLDAFIAYNKYLKNNGLKPWIDVPKSDSLLNLFGIKGSRNVKFISSNSIFEVVINYETGNIDSSDENLATANYGYSKGDLGHLYLDILPYFEYTNTYEESKTGLPRTSQFILAYGNTKIITDKEKVIRNQFSSNY